MIKYALRCQAGHLFDSWFQNSTAFEKLRDGAQLSCSFCGSAQVDRAIMAPHVVSGAQPAPDPQTPDPEAMRAAVEAQLTALRAHVEANGDYVGEQFAEEARRIHDGVTADRLIWGEATPQDATELRDEGIDIMPLPGRRQGH